MPKIGDIRSGKWYEKYIWSACVDCGREKWIHLLKGKPMSIRCKSCATKFRRNYKGKNNPSWKGGRREDGKGYIYISVDSTDFFAPMRDRHGCVFEHRLVMAKHLGRCLTPEEIIHHINGVKDDNRIGNLELINDNGKHIKNYFKEKMPYKNEKDKSEHKRKYQEQYYKKNKERRCLKSTA